MQKKAEYFVKYSFRREWDIVTNVYRSDKISELKHAVALIVSWKARLTFLPLSGYFTSLISHHRFYGKLRNDI